MKNYRQKLLSVFLSLVTVLSPVAVNSASADTLTTDASSAVREEAAPVTLTDEIVWLEADESYWNLGYNSQTVIRGKDAYIGDWFELHKTDTAVDGLAVSVDNMSNSIDIGGMHYMEFDLYLYGEGLQIFQNAVGGSLELSSSGTCDNSEISVPLSRLQAMELNEGWNHIKLDLGSFNSINGETGPFDETALNYLRFYITDGTSELWWLRLSDIKFTRYSAFGLYNADTAALSGDGDISVDAGEIVWKISNTSDLGFNLNYSAESHYRDMRGMEYLEFNFYISDVSILQDASDVQLELRSNGCVSDDCELNWDKRFINEMHLQNGWNYIKLRLDGAEATGSNPFDLSRVSWFRLYAVGLLSVVESAEIRIKGIRLSKDISDSEPIITEGSVNWSDKNGWWFNPETLSDLSRDTYKTENDTVAMEAVSNGLVAAYRTEATDISAAKYMELDIYLSDTYVISEALGGELELTSSSWCDSCEINLSLDYLKSLNWKNGWNHIRIPLSDFNSLDGQFDNTALNFMRFFLIYDETAERTLKIRNVIFTKQAADEEIKLMLSSCGSETEMAGATANASHYSYHDCKYSDGSGMFAAILDPKSIADGSFLELDLWVEDATSLFTGDAAIELTSSGGCDVEEIQFSKAKLEALGLKNGWNHLKLSLSDFTASGSGGFDNTAVNFFRIYFACYSKDLMIDNICVTYYPKPSKARIEGDANGDGITDARDLVRMKKYLALIEGVTVSTDNTDLNVDGDISLIDLVKLRNRLLGEAEDLLYYLDFDYIKSEFYNSQSTEYDVVSFLFSLQGVLNRERPTLFIDYIYDTDAFWYDYLKESGMLLYEYGCKQIESFDELIEIFSEEIADCGLVLWDENVPATSNVAATVCSATGALPVRAGSSLESRLLADTEAQIKVNLEDKFKGFGTIPDTDRDSTGSAKCDAYLWALDTYKDSIDWSVIGSYVDSFPSIVSTDLCLANHDYIIAKGGFFFDLSPWSDEVPCDDEGQTLGTDYNTLLEILKVAYEKNGGEFGTVCGYVPWPYKYSSYADENSAHTAVESEHRFVEILTSYNMVLDADSAPHGELSNASVYMHHTLAESYENNHADVTESYDKDKNYVMLYMGDYDSSAWTARYVPQMFTDENRGEFDITWSFNLNISDRCPMIFDFIYENKTENDFFSAGNSGVGYTMTNAIVNRTDSSYPSGAQAYVDYCKPYLEKFDIDYLGLALSTADLTEAELQMYTDMGFTAFGHGRENNGVISNDEIVGIQFRTLPEGSRDITQCSRYISGIIDTYTDRNVFIIRSILWTPTEIKALREAVSVLRDDVVFCCDPEGFTNMARASQNQ